MTAPPVGDGDENRYDLAPLISLYASLQALPDPRRGQGKRYELALLLSLVVLAKLAGQTTLSGATEWIRHRGKEIAHHFGLRRRQMTYCRMLAWVDANLFDEVLVALFIRWEAKPRC